MVALRIFICFLVISACSREFRTYVRRAEVLRATRAIEKYHTQVGSETFRRYKSIEIHLKSRTR